MGWGWEAHERSSQPAACPSAFRPCCVTMTRMQLLQLQILIATCVCSNGAPTASLTAVFAAARPSPSTDGSQHDPWQPNKRRVRGTEGRVCWQDSGHLLHGADS